MSQIVSNNCYDSMIFPILSHKNYDLRLIYLSCFSSIYYSKDHNKLERESHLNIFLDKVLGIKIVDVKCTDVIDQINNHLSSGPVGIYSDLYNCRWAPGYKKLHYKHFFLILNNLPNKKQYVCADIYFRDIGYFNISYEELIYIYSSMIIFKFPEHCSLDMDKLQNYLTSRFNVPDILKYNEQKERLIQLFTQQLALTDVVGVDINHSIMLLNLEWIAEDKGNFITALQFLDEYMHHNISDLLSPLLKSVRDDFILLKSLMLKYALTGVKNNNKIASIIEHISDKDIQMIKKMHDMLILEMEILNNG